MNVVDSEFNAMIEYTASFLSEIPVPSIVPFSPRKVRGTVSHRLRARGYKEKVSSNELPNRLSLVKGDTSMNVDNNPMENVTINYLS